jgi:hypothetical protein
MMMPLVTLMKEPVDGTFGRRKARDARNFIEGLGGAVLSGC